MKNTDLGATDEEVCSQMTAGRFSGVSRRNALGMLAAGGAAALAGCSVNTGSTDGGGGGSADMKEVVFPDFPTTLTDKEATLRWVDTGARKSAFVAAVLEAFTEKHPNIKTNYNPGGWQTINKVVPLGIRNGNAPDVFSKPQGVPAATMINEGWVRPIDDIIPEFDKWKATFPETTFIPGIDIFDGKLYTWPLTARNSVQVCIYDSKNLAEAGYQHPETEIKTWDDLYVALKKLVKNGKTGFMTSGPKIGSLVNNFAHTAGWHAVGGIDLRTGEFVYDAPEILQAYEFLQKLVTDKVIVPGYLTLKQDAAAAQMPAGKSGVFVSGPAYITGWRTNNPQWEYTSGAMPSPDGSPYVMPFQETGGNRFYVYAETKVPEAVGQLYGFMGSQRGQENMIALTLGTLKSQLEAANEAAKRAGILGEHAIASAEIADQVQRSVPVVAFRNDDVAKVDLVRKHVNPTWQNLWQGIFTGEIDNPKATLRKWNDKQEKALDVAIAAAKKDKGSTITRDDWVFPNWDPTKDYTLEDYKELPGYKGPQG